MPRTLTASDRSALIRLASTMEKGSEGRRAILAGLSRSAGYKPYVYLPANSGLLDHAMKFDVLNEHDFGLAPEVKRFLGRSSDFVVWEGVPGGRLLRSNGFRRVGTGQENPYMSYELWEHRDTGAPAVLFFATVVDEEGSWPESVQLSLVMNSESFEPNPDDLVP